MSATEGITAPDPSTSSAKARVRPRLISGLIAFWLLGVVFFPLMGFRAYAATGALPPLSIPLTVISAVISYGLWAGLPWARILLIVLLVPMMCLMPVGFAAFIAIAYVRRPETRRYFVPEGEGATWGAAPTWSSSEWPWILAVLAALALGAYLLIAMAPLARVW